MHKITQSLFKNFKAHCQDQKRGFNQFSNELFYKPPPPPQVNFLMQIYEKAINVSEARNVMQLCLK
jgi:hypothetical protein